MPQPSIQWASRYPGWHWYAADQILFLIPEFGIAYLYDDYDLFEINGSGYFLRHELN